MVYELTYIEYIRKDYSLTDQIRRADMSVVANIAEGYGRKTEKDYAQFLSIAIGSVNEILAFFDIISILYPEAKTSHIRTHYEGLGKQLYAFRHTLKPQNT